MLVHQRVHIIVGKLLQSPCLLTIKITISVSVLGPEIKRVPLQWIWTTHSFLGNDVEMMASIHMNCFTTEWLQFFGSKNLIITVVTPVTPVITIFPKNSITNLPFLLYFSTKMTTSPWKNHRVARELKSVVEELASTLGPGPRQPMAAPVETSPIHGETGNHSTWGVLNG